MICLRLLLLFVIGFCCSSLTTVAGDDFLTVFTTTLPLSTHQRIQMVFQLSSLPSSLRSTDTSLDPPLTSNFLGQLTTELVTMLNDVQDDLGLGDSALPITSTVMTVTPFYDSPATNTDGTQVTAYVEIEDLSTLQFDSKRAYVGLRNQYLDADSNLHRQTSILSSLVKFGQLCNTTGTVQFQSVCGPDPPHLVKDANFWYACYTGLCCMIGEILLLGWFAFHRQRLLTPDPKKVAEFAAHNERKARAAEFEKNPNGFLSPSGRVGDSTYPTQASIGGNFVDPNLNPHGGDRSGEDDVMNMAEDSMAFGRQPTLMGSKFGLQPGWTGPRLSINGGTHFREPSESHISSFDRTYSRTRTDSMMSSPMKTTFHHLPLSTPTTPLQHPALAFIRTSTSQNSSGPATAYNTNLFSPGGGAPLTPVREMHSPKLITRALEDDDSENEVSTLTLPPPSNQQPQPLPADLKHSTFPAPLSSPQGSNMISAAARPPPVMIPPSPANKITIMSPSGVGISHLTSPSSHQVAAPSPSPTTITSPSKVVSVVPSPNTTGMVPPTPRTIPTPSAVHPITTHHVSPTPSSAPVLTTPSPPHTQPTPIPSPSQIHTVSSPLSTPLHPQPIASNSVAPAITASPSPTIQTPVHTIGTISGSPSATSAAGRQIIAGVALPRPIQLVSPAKKVELQRVESEEDDEEEENS